MEYIGEHLLPGQLGHLFSILSLFSSLLATYAFFKAAKRLDGGDALYWKKLARGSFIIAALSAFAMFGILYYIIARHYFEYKYVWQHSSLSLEAKFLFASIWEGQEGSFILWSFWHCILGLVLLKRSGFWEAPVMTVVSFAQFCLATMVAGISVSGIEMGSSPFSLLRNEMEASIFTHPDYLSFIGDGNDLNPLLQNYWMVIHPPVLFLGYASVIVPFAYALSGLWLKKHKEWARPALSWGLFSAAALGAGIMMGALWAYESLTFGGFWTWDPVENAALVPWLVMIAGIHTLVVFIHTSRSLRASYLFLIASYLFVLYATFLTRSGILGDSSVHAFTNLGMNAQLLAFLLVFFIPSILLLLLRLGQIPKTQGEVHWSSREFWMFTGSCILFISAISIISTTSLPVWNQLADFLSGDNGASLKPLTIGTDAEYRYNKGLIYVAMIIGFLTAFVQYLKYKGRTFRYVLNGLRVPSVLAVVICCLLFSFGSIRYEKHGMFFWLLIWLTVASSVYAIVANFSYIWTGLKGKLRFAGGSLAHLGFGVMLLGILFSASNKEVQTGNRGAGKYAGAAEEEVGESITLLKGVRTGMDQYWVTYLSDSVQAGKSLWFYRVLFEHKSGEERFVLTPSAFVNYKDKEGLISNPDARHRWDHDLFAYLTSLPDPAKKQDAAISRGVLGNIGDTLAFESGQLVYERLVSKTNIAVSGLRQDDTVFLATLRIRFQEGTAETAGPILIKRGGQSYAVPDTVRSGNLIVRLTDVHRKGIGVTLKQRQPGIDYITLKVYKFPFIGLLWTGTILLICGLVISLVQRSKNKRPALPGRKEDVRKTAQPALFP